MTTEIELWAKATAQTIEMESVAMSQVGDPAAPLVSQPLHHGRLRPADVERLLVEAARSFPSEGEPDTEPWWLGHRYDDLAMRLRGLARHASTFAGTKSVVDVNEAVNAAVKEAQRLESSAAQHPVEEP